MQINLRQESSHTRAPRWNQVRQRRCAISHKPWQGSWFIEERERCARGGGRYLASPGRFIRLYFGEKIPRMRSSYTRVFPRPRVVQLRVLQRLWSQRSSVFGGKKKGTRMQKNLEELIYTLVGEREGCVWFFFCCFLASKSSKMLKIESPSLNWTSAIHLKNKYDISQQTF